MKKILKISFIILFSILLLSLGKNVKANSISRIDMDIYVDKNGNAEVTETWKCSASEGTEVYHPYYNLGNSKITNLSVSEQGKEYTTLSSWNTSGSLSSKAYKCGINKISNGVELCWGISQYGTHTYVVKYNISNFVSELNDAQMIYWTLIPYNFSNTIGTAYVKIHSDFKYKDNYDVWGYGDYGGTAYVYNGFIEMQSNGTLAKNEYMTILVKFPSGTFNTTNKLNHNFNYYLEMAEDGATKYEYNYSNSNVAKGTMITTLLCFSSSYIFIFKTILSSRKRELYKDLRIDFKSKTKVKKANYYRDIPCENDIFKAYYIAYQYGIIKNKTDILGAMILKWIKEGIVKLEKRERKGITKKEEEVLILGEINEQIMPLFNERKIYDMLMLASEDGILEKNELKVWCKKNYTRFLNWFDDILREQRDIMSRNGEIRVKDTIFGFKKYYSTDKVTEEAESIYGLKKFLLNFTIISKREAVEVSLFEEYLVYAQMLGIAKKVAKQFKDLYPEVVEQSNFNNYDNIIFINACTNRGIASARSAKSAAEAAARAASYSSGGGGFSSGGGGHGSFGGGGHGGGGFR